MRIEEECFYFIEISLYSTMRRMSKRKFLSILVGIGVLLTLGGYPFKVTVLGEKPEKTIIETIMGHKISSGVKKVISEVQRAFPSKKLLVHPYELAEEESGKRVDPNALAVSMPEIDGYIAIWIVKRLETDRI